MNWGEVSFNLVWILHFNHFDESETSNHRVVSHYHSKFPEWNRVAQTHKVNI